VRWTLFDYLLLYLAHGRRVSAGSRCDTYILSFPAAGVRAVPAANQLSNIRFAILGQGSEVRHRCEAGAVYATHRTREQELTRMLGYRMAGSVSPISSAASTLTLRTSVRPRAQAIALRHRRGKGITKR
jgi:hypothetical protein